MSEKIADANFYGGTRQSAQFLTRDAGVLLRVQTLLRWLAVSGQSVTIFIVGFVLEYQMPLLSCIGLVLMSVAVNILQILDKNPECMRCYDVMFMR